MEAILVGEFCCQGGSIWTLLALYLLGELLIQRSRKHAGIGSERDLVASAGQSCFWREGSKDKFDSHIPLTPARFG
jgi:hypothetical protein